jgi:hypothetical protein
MIIIFYGTYDSKTLKDGIKDLSDRCSVKEFGVVNFHYCDANTYSIRIRQRRMENDVGMNGAAGLSFLPQ